MATTKASPVMLGIYYRFQNESPRRGALVHCFTSLQTFRGFIRMMRQQDPNHKQMKCWEIEGQFVKPDNGDAIVRVVSAKEIQV